MDMGIVPEGIRHTGNATIIKEKEYWRMTRTKLILILAATIFASTCGFLLVIDAMQSRLLRKDETIKFLASEIRWQRFRADRAEARVPEYNELTFIAQMFQANDRIVYDAARSAYAWGKVYNVSPSLIMAVIHRESLFRPDAVSSAGAVGLMQVMPDVHRLDPRRLLEVDYNVQQGTRILRQYLDDAGGDVADALWRYWGRGASYSYSPRVLESKFFNGVLR